MRTKKEFKKISVTKEVYDKLQKDKLHFEKKIGGGKWSISDTITEYYKIMGDKKNGKIRP
jgi:predicted CopG family antitoxin